MRPGTQIVPFADIMLDQYPCGYVTVHDAGDKDSVICEGIVRSMALILDFRSLDIRSFFVFESEDGGVQIDIGVRTALQGAAAV